MIDFSHLLHDIYNVFQTNWAGILAIAFNIVLPKILYRGITIVTAKFISMDIAKKLSNFIVSKFNIYSAGKILIFISSLFLMVLGFFSLHSTVMDMLAYIIGVRSDIVRLEHHTIELARMVQTSTDILVAGSIAQGNTAQLVQTHLAYQTTLLTDILTQLTNNYANANVFESSTTGSDIGGNTPVSEVIRNMVNGGLGIDMTDITRLTRNSFHITNFIPRFDSSIIDLLLNTPFKQVDPRVFVDLQSNINNGVSSYLVNNRNIFMHSYMDILRNCIIPTDEAILNNNRKKAHELFNKADQSSLLSMMKLLNLSIFPSFVGLVIGVSGVCSIGYYSMKVSKEIVKYTLQ